MKYPMHILTVLMALGAMSNTAAQVSADSGTFRIMSPEEITTHGAVMANLDDHARHAYRDREYEALRQRALSQGYRLPVTPPWRTMPAAEPAIATSADDAVAARHLALREKLAARRTSIDGPGGAGPDGASAPETPGAIAAAAVEPPTTATGIATQTRPPDLAAAPATEAADESPAPTGPGAGTPASAPPAAPVGPTRPVTGQPAPLAIQVPTPPAPPEPPTPPAHAASAAMSPSGAVPDGAASPTDAMADHRETMRERFDTYMKQRQAQIEEAARRQREAHESAIEQSRASRPTYRQPYRGYRHPPSPGFGPRYPAAFPGYRVPYWQQAR